MSQLADAEWWRPAPALGARVETGADYEPHRWQGSGGAVAFWALIAFTFILVLSPQAFLPTLMRFRIALLAAVATIGARLTDSLLLDRPLSFRGPEMALTAGLLSWAIVTLPWSYWPGGSAAFLSGMYFKTVAIFWLLVNTVDTLPRLRQVAWALTIMAVPLSLTGIKDFLSGAFIDAGSPHAVGRIAGYESGPTANPNDLALMLNLIIPLSVALLLAAHNVFSRAMLLTMVALQVAGVVVTFSRAGFITLAVTFLLYICHLVRRRRTAWAAAALAIAVVGLAVLPDGYAARMATITDIDSDATGSAQARWSDTLAAARFIMSHPVIGAGVGMNTLALNEVRGPVWAEIHNAYLQYGVDLGLPGLVLFILLLLACLRKLRGMRRRGERAPISSELSYLAEGIEMALLAFAVAAFFSPVAYQFYFYYLAGLAVVAGRIPRYLSGQEKGGITP